MAVYWADVSSEVNGPMAILLFPKSLHFPGRLGYREPIRLTSHEQGKRIIVSDG